MQRRAMSAPTVAHGMAHRHTSGTPHVSCTKGPHSFYQRARCGPRSNPHCKPAAGNATRSIVEHHSFRALDSTAVLLWRFRAIVMYSRNIWQLNTLSSNVSVVGVITGSSQGLLRIPKEPSVSVI